MSGNTAVLHTEKFTEIWGRDESRSRRSPEVWTLVAGSRVGEDKRAREVRRLESIEQRGSGASRRHVTSTGISDTAAVLMNRG